MRSCAARLVLHPFGGSHRPVCSEAALVEPAVAVVHAAGATMIGPPVTDEELDMIEDLAHNLIDAIEAGDLDSAYIIASTCPEPVMLAMIVTELMLG